MNFEICHRIYKQSNNCDVICKSVYVVDALNKLVSKHEKVVKVVQVNKKSFKFSTKEHDDINDVLNAIIDATPDIIGRALVDRIFRRRMKFWIAWAVVWGSWDFFLEVMNIFSGNRSHAMICGFAGLLIVLFSLKNYWDLRKKYEELKENGDL